MSQLDAAQPDLTNAQQTAIDFAKVMMADPGSVPAELTSRLRAHFTDEQITELALDVMKWSYQKYAVALGLDREIRAGELTDLVFDESGNWVRPV